MKIQWAGAILAILPFAAAGQDTSTPKLDQGAKKMMRSHDTMFAMAAARGGIAEVETGKLAADKASSPDVKAFGQQMVDDHGKANEQLKSVAEKQNLTLPTTMNAKQQAMYDMLKGKTGAEFDKAYVDAMVKDHEEDVKEFQREADKGKDEQIKAFASETLPVIQGHLEKIKGIQSKMGGA
jgi:putative membrane protein